MAENRTVGLLTSLVTFCDIYIGWDSYPGALLVSSGILMIGCVLLLYILIVPAGFGGWTNLCEKEEMKLTIVYL
jgi:hypothetical protein